MLFYIAILCASIASTNAFNSTFVIPFNFPLFKQCDSRWGDDLMGTKTICSVGCLMSSTAMGLAGTHIPIKVLPSTPKVLNEWLKNNEGYDGNNLIETQVPLINPDRIAWPDDGFHKTKDLSFVEVTEYINKGRIVIGNVNNGGHFVLLTGYSTEDGDSFAVNDPGYSRDTYSYEKDLVGFRIYDMNRLKAEEVEK